MHGLMMDSPLMISSLIEYAARNHADTEIVSRQADGAVHRYDYGRCYQRTCQLAHALRAIGIEHGDRVGTLAWNGYRHLELYYAISGIGAVCHTVNPRLFSEQLVYIMNHAADRVLFVDLSFVPLLESLAAQLSSVRAYVLMCDEQEMPRTSLPTEHCYETLIRSSPMHFQWPQFDEREASSLCYTSGTTGAPKGVLYNHRSTVLHAYSLCSANSALPLSCRETVMPVVPMFHVHAWGIPYAAAMAGARIVFPGAQLDGASLHELIETEAVTQSAGVPTIWFALLAYLAQSGASIDSLRNLVVGGAAAPLSLIEQFEQRYGVNVCHAWGMTEMSPVGTTGMLKPRFDALSEEQRFSIKLKQGRMVYGVEMKIVDDDGVEQACNGSGVGQLLVRGPWIAAAYFEDAEGTAHSFTDDGWFCTGDVATLDADGHVQIVDRSKDLIKSGGEWISSIDLENTAVGHPDIVEAAAIAITHEKWGERPLLVVVLGEGRELTSEATLAWLEDKVARWWLPDRVMFVDELPHTATGKISKTQLRERISAMDKSADSC
jgi:acyl-CoA synthetase (AMP-forming)/AMP-acid ligase II